MDGQESKDDVQRCEIWDLLFEAGELSCADIKDELGTKTSVAKIKSLTQHDWFTHRGDLVSVAR